MSKIAIGQTLTRQSISGHKCSEAKRLDWLQNLVEDSGGLTNPNYFIAPQ